MEWRDNESNQEGGFEAAAGIVCILAIVLAFIFAANCAVYLFLKLIGAEL